MKKQIVLFICLISVLYNVNSMRNNNQEENLVDSVSYSVARTQTNEYYEKNYNDFKNPEYVEKLPPRKQLRGETTTVEEIKSDANYYDGSKRVQEEGALKKDVTVEKLCGEWTTHPAACKRTGNCGWCASTNSCIPGNAKGPLLPCQKGAFEFVEPPKDWNPFPKDVEVNINKHKVGDSEIITISPK